MLRVTISAWLFGLSLLGAERSLPVPENLRVQGTPAIPITLMEKITPYGESRSAALLDWHPLKREMLVATRFADVPQVHHVAMPGGARTQLTFYPDRVARARYDPKSGSRFCFLKDVGGGEFYQIYLYEVDTGDAVLLTDGKSRNMGPLWSRDGRSLIYSSTRRNGRDTDLYIADPSVPQSTRKLLEVEGGGWSVADWSPDNSSVVVQEYRSIAESVLYLVNVATGAKQRLTPEGEKASYSEAQFSADGKGLYLATDSGSEFLRPAYLDLSSRKLAFLRRDLNWDVEYIALSKDGRRLAYVANEGGSSVLHVMDTATKRELNLPKIPLGVIGEIQWHNNAKDLGFSLSSAKSPFDVYSIDVEQASLTRWTRSETGGLNPERFVEPEAIRWKSFDGQMIWGFLYRPPARFTGPRPVIVSIHGGPESQYQPAYLGRGNYLLNTLGVALIYPNVRGSSGHGKTYVRLDNGVKREDSVKDIGTLLDWIGSQKDLDSSRIMVTGGSYGGYMTLASMVHYNDRLRCGLSVVGISNWITFLERTEAYRRDLRRAEYGDERDPQMREFLTRISPLNGANRITKPMFIVQGKNDPRVPMKESEQMVEAIRKNGGAVWYLLAEDEGHGFAKKKNQDYQFAATVLFVEEFLLK